MQQTNEISGVCSPQNVWNIELMFDSMQQKSRLIVFSIFYCPIYVSNPSMDLFKTLIHLE